MTRERSVMLAALGSSVAWQVYVAVVALRFGPRADPVAQRRRPCMDGAEPVKVDPKTLAGRWTN